MKALEAAKALTRWDRQDKSVFAVADLRRIFPERSEKTFSEGIRRLVAQGVVPKLPQGVGRMLPPPVARDRERPLRLNASARAAPERRWLLRMRRNGCRPVARLPGVGIGSAPGGASVLYRERPIRGPQSRVPGREHGRPGRAPTSPGHLARKCLPRLALTRRFAGFTLAPAINNEAARSVGSPAE